MSQSILGPSLTWPDHARLIGAISIQNGFSEKCSLPERGSRLPQQLQLVRSKLAIIPSKCQN